MAGGGNGYVKVSSPVKQKKETKNVEAVKFDEAGFKTKCEEQFQRRSDIIF